MDDRKIRCLLTVLEMGSINAAAERLHGTQSGITQTMNAIENELGFKILNRTSKGVTLTSEGKEILPVIRKLNADFTRLERQAADIARGANTIRIGTYSSIANAWLPEMISLYEEVNPDVSFEIMIGCDEVPEWLGAGKVDMLLVDEDMAEGYDWHPIFRDEYHVAVPNSFKISEKEVLTEADLVDYPMIVGTLNTNRKLREIPESIHGRVIKVGADDDTTIIRMISKGLGVSVMAGLSIRQLLPDNVSVIRFEPPIYRVIGAALPTRPSSAVKRFTKFVIKENDGRDIIA